VNCLIFERTGRREGGKDLGVRAARRCEDPATVTGASAWISKPKKSSRLPAFLLNSRDYAAIEATVQVCEVAP
jgi:hypothetical protein